MNKLAYKTMNPVIYYSVNVGMYVLVIVMAIFIDSIGLMFSFIATFAGSGLSFFIPSSLFYIGYTKYADQKY